jgi:spore coat polysaccharide biosynthesis protein SpsF
MRSAIFLSVRNKATRLPGKALLDLGGAPVTQRLLERLRQSREADRVVLTTSTHPDDAVLVDLARRVGVDAFCGSEDDKLDRYLQAARAHDIDLAVIVDGDDPLCDPGYIDRVIRRARETGADYVGCAGLPVGVAASGVRVDALERVCRLKTEHDTEVWGGYFTDTGLFTVSTVEADPAHTAPDVRMTLDYPEDYAFFQELYRALGQGPLALDDVLGLLRRRPDVAEVNQAAQAAYEANLRRITRVGIRTEDLPCGS